MQPSDKLIDALFLEQVRRAKRMTPEEKFLAGPRLFEYAVKIAKEAIRQQHPDADEEEVDRLLRHRLQLSRRLDEQERSRSSKENIDER